MNKLYERIDFVNGTTPALNDTNLNAMSKAIDDIDDRVVTLGTYAEDAEEAAETAETAKTSAVASATSASASAASAKEYAQEARGYTPTGYQDLVNIVDDNVNLGYLGKNLLPITLKTTTKNGITFTVNDDKSITVNGTATAETYFNTAVNIPITQDCTASAITSGSSGTYQFRLVYDTNKVYVVEKSPITIPAGITITQWQIKIWSGQTLSNVTFYPMLRYADITDDTYVPYVPSNATLAETDAELEEKDAELVKKDAELTAKATNIMGTSDAYSSTTSYAVDDFCIDDNALYKCLIACSGVQPSTDTSGYWEKVTLASLASSVPVFDIHTLTRELVTDSLTNANSNTEYTIPKDGWYQIQHTANGATCSVLYTTLDYEDSSSNIYHLFQSWIQLNTSTSSQNSVTTPPFYFKKGDTMVYRTYCNSSSGTPVHRLYCWS